jgi:branched-chain amino acid transport system ATP-binding protein
VVAPEGILGAIANAWMRLVRSASAVSGSQRPQEAPAAVPDAPAGPEDPAGPLLELRGVVAGYGRGAVLHDIDLRIDKGEIVALIGANGVGKSTLLRAISQVIPLARGQIWWAGKPLAGLAGGSAAGVARAGVAHVPEGRGIFPDLTVAENLRMGRFARPSHVRGETVAATLESVLEQFPNLRSRLRQRAGTLSGGEQQMLAIGRALMTEPELLMLDEPSLGLSPLLRTQVLEAVRAIADGGRSVLLVEQNARAALAISDRAYVLSGGRIAMAGPAAELRDNEDVARTYMALS